MAFLFNPCAPCCGGGSGSGNVCCPLSELPNQLCWQTNSTAGYDISNVTLNRVDKNTWYGNGLITHTIARTGTLFSVTMTCSTIPNDFISVPRYDCQFSGLPLPEPNFGIPFPLDISDSILPNVRIGKFSCANATGNFAVYLDGYDSITDPGSSHLWNGNIAPGPCCNSCCPTQAISNTIDVDSWGVSLIPGCVCYLPYHTTATYNNTINAWEVTLNNLCGSSESLYISLFCATSGYVGTIQGFDGSLVTNRCVYVASWSGCAGQGSIILDSADTCSVCQPWYQVMFVPLNPTTASCGCSDLSQAHHVLSILFSDPNYKVQMSGCCGSINLPSKVYASFTDNGIAGLDCGILRNASPVPLIYNPAIELGSPWFSTQAVPGWVMGCNVDSQSFVGGSGLFPSDRFMWIMCSGSTYYMAMTCQEFADVLQNSSAQIVAAKTVNCSPLLLTFEFDFVYPCCAITGTVFNPSWRYLVTVTE